MSILGDDWKDKKNKWADEGCMPPDETGEQVEELMGKLGTDMAAGLLSIGTRIDYARRFRNAREERGIAEEVYRRALSILDVHESVISEDTAADGNGSNGAKNTAR